MAEEMKSPLERSMALLHDLSQGGRWLSAARDWMQRNVPRGDTLTWNSGEPVTVPFCKLEELALTAAHAAVTEDREKLPSLWNRNAHEIPADTAVLCYLKGKAIPVMASMSVHEEFSVLLDQEWYGFIFHHDQIERWLDVSKLA